jgi:hypothetical protein
MTAMRITGTPAGMRRTCGTRGWQMGDRLI